jgi:hypothetical protein
VRKSRGQLTVLCKLLNWGAAGVVNGRALMFFLNHNGLIGGFLLYFNLCSKSTFMILVNVLRALLVLSVLLSCAFGQNILDELAAAPNGLRIEDPTFNFARCSLYTLPQPNSYTTNGTIYTLQLGDDFKGGGGSASIFLHPPLTYTSSQSGGSRGQGCAPPPGNYTVSPDGVQTITGLLANCRYAFT